MLRKSYPRPAWLGVDPEHRETELCKQGIHDIELHDSSTLNLGFLPRCLWCGKKYEPVAQQEGMFE